MSEDIKKSANNLVIIDADSIIYLIGYELMDMLLEPLGLSKLDEFIQDIMITTGSKEYLGYFGGIGGQNFRYNVAVTKPYKGNRQKEKEEWYKFWEPILKKRMEEHWGFVPCYNIEADDAVAIAANKYRGKYNKVIVASPDKDLYQIPDMHFYDFMKRISIYSSSTISISKLCTQLVTGDTTDNIPGCLGAGPAKAKDVVAEIADAGMNFDDAMKRMLEFYIDWHCVVLKDKAVKKQCTEYLLQYKVDNDIKKWNKVLKDKALQSFVPDVSQIMQKLDVKIFFMEQFALLHMLDTEKEGLKHGFTMQEPTLDTSINWEEIDIFEDEIEMMDEEEDFEFEGIL